jgi:ABC-type branched-subunit amino acid transport system ATPase component
MLEVKNISSGYNKKQVLYDVSLTVKPGEAILLTGGNGSGKSTLLKCIYNLLPLWNGTIWFENERIDALKPSDLIRKGIVYIPQNEYCFENLTIEENLKIAGTIITKKELKPKVEDVLLTTGLYDLRKKKPFYLSGGEKKILAFAMSLLHNPKLVLFDEPFSGVDRSNEANLIGLFRKIFLNNNISVILVEHKEAHIDLSNRRIAMELGTIKTI